MLGSEYLTRFGLARTLFFFFAGSEARADCNEDGGSSVDEVEKVYIPGGCCGFLRDRVVL